MIQMKPEDERKQRPPSWTSPLVEWDLKSPTVTVRVEWVYGQECAYPADENARLFSQLTGRKTLLKTDLKRIKALGFQIEQEQRVADMLKEVVGNVGNE